MAVPSRLRVPTSMLPGPGWFSTYAFNVDPASPPLHFWPPRGRRSSAGTPGCRGCSRARPGRIRDAGVLRRSSSSSKATAGAHSRQMGQWGEGWQARKPPLRNKLRKQEGTVKASPITSSRIPPSLHRGVIHAVPVFAAPLREGLDNVATSFSATRTAAGLARCLTRALLGATGCSYRLPLRLCSTREHLTGYFMWPRVGALI
ncbi:hypothetical protein NDU88_006227 [Pleurodeles waltl]|uniref:Uncharacterized protein n=1 Tax=Pleurodeles waltl TaxID=8319 RepID=A0AAV7LWC8_PLEWA|nr:hypothetical protein NDU88_006227 [Pleurodeles waltl]